MMKLEHQIAKRFAETALYWRGHLRAKEVQKFLGVSERTARSFISDWRHWRLLPKYRHEAKCLKPSDDFNPKSPASDLSIAFNLLLMGDKFIGNPFALFGPIGGGHDLSIRQQIFSEATRNIISACINCQPVHMIYISKDGRQDLVFHPSALVRTRGRYHFRGYRDSGINVSSGTQLENRYVDVVPARALEATITENLAFVGLKKDNDWNCIENSTFYLSDELSDVEKLCYDNEYGLIDKTELKIEARRALMPYIRQELTEHKCWRRDNTSVQIWKEKTDN